MRIGSIALVTTLLAMLAAVGWFAYSGLSAGSKPMPTEGYIALIAGVTFKLLQLLPRAHETARTSCRPAASAMIDATTETPI